MMYLYGFSEPFLFLSFKQQKKERGGYRDKCTREQQKVRCVPVLQCFGRHGSGGRFFGDYRLCLKLAIKPMTASPQWLLAYWINVSKPPAKIKVSKGPSRPSVITHRLRRRAGSRMHNPCLSWLRRYFHRGSRIWRRRIWPHSDRSFRSFSWSVRPGRSCARIRGVPFALRLTDRVSDEKRLFPGQRARPCSGTPIRLVCCNKKTGRSTQSAATNARV